MSESIRVKKLRPSAEMPRRATKGSAGADLHACIEKTVILKPGERTLVPTGIAMELDDSSLAAFIFARSGLAVKYGITLSNAVGVIDSDYRGEICVGLINLSDKDFPINPGDRIAQLVIMPVVCASFVQADELSDTERGDGGFGSSGI